MNAVRTEIVRMVLVVIILAAISAWQFNFLLSAVGSNPALNLMILGTFAFGLILIVGVMANLQNEFRALFALMEQYEDDRHHNEMQGADPHWRMYRCRSVGLVFQKPKILGQSYQLISERLAREGRLSISAGTMQTLVSGIDERLSESRSLISYVSGTLVFLGLIGTFIGLMVTLASVGTILGSLDLTGSDPTETVAALMTNLQTPLGGMATGFSSSLFGLVTSLTITILMQMLNRSGRALKAGFTDWLGNVVELSDGVEGGATGDAATYMEERRLALLMRTARYCVQTTNKQARQLADLRDSVQDLAQAQRLQRTDSAYMIAALRTLTEHSRQIHSAIGRAVEAMRVTAAAKSPTEELEALSRMLALEARARDEQTRKLVEDIHARIDQIADLQVSERGEHSAAEADALSSALANDIGSLNVAQLNAVLDSLYRQETDDESVNVDRRPVAANAKGAR